MAYVNVDDVVLHYEVYGHGLPFILLHGNGDDMQFFYHQIPVLSLQFRVLCIDTRGHGKSTRGTKQMSYETFSEDLHMFMDSLGIFKAHLLGFCDGANIALQFALTHPNRIAALILNAPRLDPDGMINILHMQLKWKYACLNPLSLISKKMKKEKEYLYLLLNEPALTYDMLSNIPLNTMIIAGEKDIIKEDHLRAIARAMPHCVLRIVPGSDHALANKNPDKFNEEVLKFLHGFS